MKCTNRWLQTVLQHHNMIRAESSVIFPSATRKKSPNWVENLRMATGIEIGHFGRPATILMLLYSDALLGFPFFVPKPFDHVDLKLGMT